jgi:hypothetical protein
LKGKDMRFETAVIFLALAGCGMAADAADPVSTQDVGQLSSALIAPACSDAQLQAATTGQNILLDAVIDAANAYAANTNSQEAIDYFGQRDEQQTLTVYYNLLWAIQTLRGDGGNFDIEINCASTDMCPPGNLAWSEIPYFTAVCDPADGRFWAEYPYWMAHEMFHWLGWGDPQNLGSCGGDCVQDVLDIAKVFPSIAIEMPHAYATYIRKYIDARFPGPPYP